MRKYLKDLTLILVLMFLLFFKCGGQAVQADKATFEQKPDGTYILVQYDFYDGMSTNPKTSFKPTGKVEDYLWEKTIKRIQSGEVTSIQNFEMSNKDFNEGDYMIAGYTPRYDRLEQRFSDHPSGKDYWIIRLKAYIPDTPHFASISLFPNPMYGEETNLFVSKEFTNGKFWITLFDFLGKQVRLIPIKDKQTKIKKEDMTPGVYFYTVNSISLTGPKGKFVVL